MRSVGNCRESPLPNTKIAGMWSTSTSRAAFTDIAACYPVPFPSPTFLIHREPSPNSGLREATHEAPGRVPAGEPISPKRRHCQCVARAPLSGLVQCVPNKVCCWDVGEVGDRVRPGELGQK